MTKFKLYEDILSRSWNRYFYDVEANTIEEAVEKVRYEEVDCYDSEQIYEVIDELDPVIIMEVLLERFIMIRMNLCGIMPN